VAIARAIVGKPKVLLLDEPLGALDLQLRRQMQLELKKLQTRLGITFIYITHDQEESLTMSDYIAVMRGGVFEQIGSPSDVYDRPKTSYVASFVGSANIVSGEVVVVDKDIVEFRTEYGSAQVAQRGAAITPGQRVTVAVRRENVRLLPKTAEAQGLSATVREKSFAGGLLQIYLSFADGSELVASRHGIDTELKTGDEVWASWTPENAVLVDLEENR
jgi:spermidine/putrescine transport system ATP-binding protein